MSDDKPAATRVLTEAQAAQVDAILAEAPQPTEAMRELMAEDLDDGGPDCKDGEYLVAAGVRAGLALTTPAPEGSKETRVQCEFLRELPGETWWCIRERGHDGPHGFGLGSEEAIERLCARLAETERALETEREAGARALDDLLEKHDRELYEAHARGAHQLAAGVKPACCDDKERVEGALAEERAHHATTLRASADALRVSCEAREAARERAAWVRGRIAAIVNASIERFDERSGYKRPVLRCGCGNAWYEEEKPEHTAECIVPRLLVALSEPVSEGSGGEPQR